MIYALGGYDGTHVSIDGSKRFEFHSIFQFPQRQSTGERYCPKTNQWTMIAPMHFQRSDADACSLDGKIYITGGFNGQEWYSRKN